MNNTELSSGFQIPMDMVIGVALVAALIGLWVFLKKRSY
jgi:hypothetical protein